MPAQPNLADLAVQSQTPAQRASQFGPTVRPKPNARQLELMKQRRMKVDQMRQERERQKAVERIKAQVVYSPFLTSPQKSGYDPVPPGLGVQRDPQLGMPVGIDAGKLSPQDRAVYLAMANTGGE